MPRTLHAVIGPRAIVAEFADRWHLARLVDLPRDFALVPLTVELGDDIDDLVAARRPAPFAEFERLSAGVATVLEAASAGGLIGYVEADAGGVGVQVAVAWERGRVAFGPARTETSREGEGTGTHPAGASAIDRALAALGVPTRGESSPFEVLRLGRFGDTGAAARRADA